MTSVTTTPPQRPPGVYGIVIDSVQHGVLGSIRLTYHEGNITIKPVSIMGGDVQQEWQIYPSKDGKNFIIRRPSDKWPSPFLTYEGPLEEGSLIKLQESDSPPNEWHFKPVPDSPLFWIVVADSDLGIKVSLSVKTISEPPDIALVLSAKDPEKWSFEPVGKRKE